MALGTGKPENPLLAPWPPGVACRAIHDPRHGLLLQLRPGASTPPELLVAERQIDSVEQDAQQRSAQDWFRRTHGRLAHA